MALRHGATMLAGVGILFLGSLLLGARPGVGLSDLAALIYPPDPQDAPGIVLREMRLPRSCAALLAGAALGAAGAVIQTLSRNPLADPGLLGVNAGAAFGIALTVWLGGPLSAGQLIVPALIGAGLASAVIWALGAAMRNPLTLILGGAALTAMLGAALHGVMLIDNGALDALRYWSVGSVDAVPPGSLGPAALLALVGAGLAMAAARRLDAMSLGEDVAQALGTSLGLTRALALGATAVLSAAAVLVAGPLAFVGLVAPHVARMAGASGTGTLCVLSAAGGGALVLLADIAGRVILPGLVIEAGLGVTLIGGPVLIWLVRRHAAGDI